MTGLSPLSPDSTDWYMQMVTLPLPPCDAAQLKSRLYDEFRIQVPIIVWQDKPFIRISVQAYNMQQNVDQLLQALTILLGS
jgi:isopenicillin-N epimerase